MLFTEKTELFANRIGVFTLSETNSTYRASVV